jgi:GNAT superfamily N-acetyltransferase
VVGIDLRIIKEMLSIRPATAKDVALLSVLIRELAEYEHELELVVTTEADLLRDGFGPQRNFRALIAQWGEQPAGYALFFGVYSTWAGRSGLFLEDLFVRPQFRGKGIGTELLAAVARIAVAENCYGVRWEVLHWNQGAIRLYEALGAEFLDDHKAVLFSGEPLRQLAGKAA